MTAVDLQMLERGKHGSHQRQRMLAEAATQVFAEKGYDCATTREIAERSGCSEGLIHRYFGGKHGLLVTILQHKADEGVAAAEASMPECALLDEEIERMVLSALDTYWTQRDFMRVCVSQASIDPEIGDAIGERLHGARVRFMRQRLQRHQDAGRVRADVDIGAIALAITGLNLSMGFFGQVAFGMDRVALRRQAREIARVITAGLAPDGAEEVER